MDHQNTYEMEIDIAKIVQAAKEIWYYCAAIIMVTTAVAFGITKFAIAEQYQAVAKIIVVSNQGMGERYSLSYADVQLSQKLTDTYAQIILSERISDLVVNRLSRRITNADYRNIVKVNANANTEIMNIVVTHTDRFFATTLANEIVHIFISEISSIMPVNNVSILNQAKTPSGPVSPSVTTNTAIGGILGGMVSGLLVLIRLYTDRKVKEESDIADILSFPVIGIVPNNEHGNNTDKRKQNAIRINGSSYLEIQSNVISLSQPNSIIAESYRALRTNVMLRNFDRELKVINVASFGQGEGKTTLIINLAMVLGQIGKKVLLIDLDLRSPKVHKTLRIKNEGGIVGLTNSEKISQVSVQSFQENVDVVTAGESIPFTSEFLQSNTLSRFIATAKEEYDYVLLDCPPAGIITDGTIVSKIADGTLVVVGYDMVEKKHLHQLDQLIRQFNINVIGCVLNRAPLVKQNYGSYYSYYEDTEKKPMPEPVMKGHA